MSQTLKQAVEDQRALLSERLGGTLDAIASDLVKHMGSRDHLEDNLAGACAAFKDCKYLYVMNASGIQLTSNLSKQGPDEKQFGRDRSLRPYMAGMFGKTDFRLSDAYISNNKRRPALTAIQVLRNDSGKRVGFLGIDYDLRELSQTEALYKEEKGWQQIKGDPSIRGALFTQTRQQSLMDDHMDDVFSLMEELIIEQGVFHGKFHFASSRATIWHVDDPYDYRILTIDELIDPDICLAYPRRAYFDRATVPAVMIMQIFRQFGALRFADETIYLRAGSINIVNGMVGLNFSCDGSHYIPWQEFLEKGLEFWFGASA